MQKYSLIAFFVLSPFIACAMESDSSSFFSSWNISSWSGSNKVLTPLQEVQKSKSEFEAQLQLEWSFKTMLPRTNRLFSPSSIKSNPVEFLKFCYHQKLYEELMGVCIDLSDLNQDISLLNACKEARIDGYSALGAAIIAEPAFSFMDNTTEIKPAFVLSLVEIGFEFTEKDKTLMALTLYKSIPKKQQKTMIFLLQNHRDEEGYFSMPLDVRKYIVQYIMRLFKTEVWLCSLL